MLKKTPQKPHDGSTHRSSRKMAAAPGLSSPTIHRIWSRTRLKPHRPDRYMASNDPAFDTDGHRHNANNVRDVNRECIFIELPPRRLIDELPGSTLALAIG